MSAPRDYAQVRRELADAGYRGERVVALDAADVALPPLAWISQTREVHRGCESERIVVQQRFLHDPRCAPMQTECTPKLFEFEAVERRSVVAGFDGGNITSNAGALLLGQVDRGLGRASLRRLLHRSARPSLCRAS